MDQFNLILYRFVTRLALLLLLSLFIDLIYSCFMLTATFELSLSLSLSLSYSIFLPNIS